MNTVGGTRYLCVKFYSIMVLPSFVFRLSLPTHPAISPVPPPKFSSTIRFSLSVFTTEEEIRYTLQALEELVPMLRRYTRRR